MRLVLSSFLLLLIVRPLYSMDEMTIYELLDPSTHKFAIQYDVSATEPGSNVFFNIIRPGSEASNEKVIDRGTGKELPLEMSTGKEAKAAGQADKETLDETKFIRVPLPHPVPQEGEYRLRIFKTYADPKSYFVENNLLIFDRSLGVKRNIVILPAGYELIGCSVPAMVSQEADGRIKISMVNDRDDELGMRITARKLRQSK
jgi:hypothetical protein